MDCFLFQTWFGSSFFIVFSLVSVEFSCSSEIGQKTAAAPESSTVSRMIRVPEERLETSGSLLHAKLNAMDRRTSTRTTVFLLAGGMIMARNIPYKSTPRADTTLAGSTLPMITPRQVPKAQNPKALTARP